MTVGASDRPPGRPPRYREQSSLVRSTGRSTGQLCCQTCTVLCTSVDLSVDRPLVRSTARSTDLTCQPVLGLINRVKIILKLLLTFYIEIQTCVINFNTNFKHYELFLCYRNFAKNQNLYFLKTWIFE